MKVRVLIEVEPLEDERGNIEGDPISYVTEKLNEAIEFSGAFGHTSKYLISEQTHKILSISLAEEE
jgi:hypothetical protein